MECHSASVEVSPARQVPGIHPRSSRLAAVLSSWATLPVLHAHLDRQLLDLLQLPGNTVKAPALSRRWLSHTLPVLSHDGASFISFEERSTNRLDQGS